MKKQENILASSLLSKLDFLTPTIDFQVRCLGYDCRTVEYATRMTRYLVRGNGIKPGFPYKRKASEHDIKKKFFEFCNAHARRHGLRYRRDLAIAYCKRYNIAL